MDTMGAARATPGIDPPRAILLAQLPRDHLLPRYAEDLRNPDELPEILVIGQGRWRATGPAVL